MRLTRLTCNQLDRPLGVDSGTLRFGWILEAGPGESAVQTAYRLRVRDEDGGLVLDTGRIESRESQQIVLRVPGLLPSRVYRWEACVWDGDGKPSAWSEPSSFATGLLPPGGWEHVPFLTARAPLEERLRDTFWFRCDAVGFVPLAA